MSVVPLIYIYIPQLLYLILAPQTSELNLAWMDGKFLLWGSSYLTGFYSVIRETGASQSVQGQPPA